MAKNLELDASTYIHTYIHDNYITRRPSLCNESNALPCRIRLQFAAGRHAAATHCSRENTQRARITEFTRSAVGYRGRERQQRSVGAVDDTGGGCVCPDHA